jgi:serine phosphatase RsbU (regulator of sigma subunit)
MPIGIYHGKKESFTNNMIKVAKGDIIYFLSDGFIDQFGGPEGAKFKRANLKKLLYEISMKPLSEQKEILISQFENWKGSLNQVDDVTVIGLKI